MRKDHPIAKKGKITLKNYLNLSHVHISKRNSGLGHVDMTLYRLGLTRRIALRAQHYLVAPYILEQSDLVITSIKSFARGRELKVFKLPFDINPLILHLYCTTTLSVVIFVPLICSSIKYMPFSK